MYQNLYNLLNTYIFGGQVVSGSYEELVCILVSTIGVLVLIGLPFLVVFKILKLVLGR